MELVFIVVVGYIALCFAVCLAAVVLNAITAIVLVVVLFPGAMIGLLFAKAFNLLLWTLGKEQRFS